MPKFKHGKKLITSLLCTMLVLLMFFSIVPVLDFQKDKNKSQITPNASEYSSLSSSQVYDFERGRFENKRDENYKRYNYFSISNYEELLEFSISVANGCDFSKDVDPYRKTVFLENDINASADGNKKNANWQPIGASMYGTKYNGAEAFSGLFDGNNYTIKNLTCRIESVKDDLYLGFMAMINCGRVQNLKIKNMRYFIDTGTPRLGGIVGAAGGWVTINNCIIDGLYVETNMDLLYISGFCGCMVAYTDLGISDCIIRDVEVFKINNYLENVSCYKFGPAYNKSTFADKFSATITFFHDLAEAATLGGDLIENFFGEAASLDFKWELSVERVIVDIQDEKFEKDYLTTGTGEKLEASINSCYDTKEEARSGLKSRPEWYQTLTNDFNEGWPYLVSFIEFNTYTFVTSENGSVLLGCEGNSISVPKEVEVEIPINQTKLGIIGISVEAIPDMNYVFCFWSYNPETKTYTAQFDKEYYHLKFRLIDENGNEMTSGVDIVEYTYTIEYGMEMQGFSSKIVGVEIDWKVGNYYACTVPIKYVLYSITILNTEYHNGEIIKIPDLGDNYDEYTATLTFKLKDYNVEYK